MEYVLMAKTANTVDPTVKAEQERIKALEAQLKTLEAAHKAAKDATERENIAAEIETVKDEINPNRHSISAGVSEKFAEAVRQAARTKQWTVQTFLRYHLERAVGRNPVQPPPETGEAYSLGVLVDRSTKEAITDKLPADGSMAQFLREIAADAAGYDLSQEPERLPTGEALAKFRERTKVKDSILATLWETNPLMVKRIVEEQGKTLTDAGFPEIDDSGKPI